MWTWVSVVCTHQASIRHARKGFVVVGCVFHHYSSGSALSHVSSGRSKSWGDAAQERECKKERDTMRVG